MTNKLPRLSSKDIIKAIEKVGFSLARQSGSHKIYKNASDNRVTVPHHFGKIIHPKVLKNILNDADLTVEELKNLL